MSPRKHPRYPFYFHYRHLVEKRGFPEIEGLECEKGSWWYPAMGRDTPDMNDETAIPYIWNEWLRRCPDKLLRRWADPAALRRSWLRHG